MNTVIARIDATKLPDSGAALCWLGWKPDGTTLVLTLPALALDALAVLGIYLRLRGNRSPLSTAGVVAAGFIAVRAALSSGLIGSLFPKQNQEA
jgi:hypothetical protein